MPQSESELHPDFRPSMKSRWFLASLDKLGTWILLKKYYKIYIILNIYIYVTHLLHVSKVLNT